MNRYERRLPHWQSIGQPLFVTFRLDGSLPVNRTFPPAHLTSGRAFVAMDRLLDQPVCVPVFLQQPEIAGMVVDALHAGEGRFHRYQLHSYVVMSNHVHVLVTPHVDGKQWLGPLKGFTAHEANRILGRVGRFWQDESYDRLVRDNNEFQRVQRYIENNPVAAGICTSPEEFPWSSAAPGRSPAAG